MHCNRPVTPAKGSLRRADGEHSPLPQNHRLALIGEFVPIPEDLLNQECITFRSQTTGALYAWEFERGRRNWRVPVRGGVVTSDGRLTASLAEQRVGLGFSSTSPACRGARQPYASSWR